MSKNHDNMPRENAPESRSAEEDCYLPTRVTLLSRLRDWDDRDSWQEFFEMYWQLIYGTAKRAGLAEAEAQDVVQEVLVSASKGLPKFRYDPSKGSFKGWLVRITKNKIADQYRKQPPWSEHKKPQPPATGEAVDESIDEICGVDESDIDSYWELEWKRTMTATAMRRVRTKVSARQFQIFDLYVCQDHTAKEVCAALNVSRVQVYLAKDRVAKKIREEVRRLEKETGETAAP